MGKENEKKQPTRKDLEDQIREATQEINARLGAAKFSGDYPAQLEKLEKRLQKYGSAPSPTKRNESVGLGFRGKRKNQLERQLGELNRALNADIWTPEAIEDISDKEQQAYESFNRNNQTDWSFEKWKEFVDTFGNIDDTLKRQFGYEKYSSGQGRKRRKYKGKAPKRGTNNDSLIYAFEEAYENNVDLMDAMNTVIKKSKGKGLSQRRAITKLMKEIRNK